LIANVTIPQVIVLSDMSKVMIRNWRVHSSSLYLKKLAHSVMPIRVFLGCFEYRFLELDREFKVEYYKYILDYTTMFLLSYKTMQNNYNR